MKNLLFLTAGLALLCSTVRAQMGAGTGAGLDAAMIKVFGKNNSFSSTAEFTYRGADQPDPVTMSTSLKMLNGKTRTEMDISKSSKMPANMTAQLKQLGMDRVIAIFEPGASFNLLIYPGLKAYAEMPNRNNETGAGGKNLKVDKTSIGRETIEGHPCEKNRIVITGANGDTHQFTVWNASDMNDFPVQMQTSEKESSVLMKFHDIKLSKPDASLFVPPSGYTKYSSPQELMRAAVMKQYGSGSQK